MTSSIHSVSPARRKAIVSRGKGGAGITQVTAAELQNEAELAFAVRFLMDHYTYKRSKSAGVTAGPVSEAWRAVCEAANNFADEVATPNGITPDGAEAAAKPATPVVSELGSGKIVNPFNYV